VASLGAPGQSEAGLDGVTVVVGVCGGIAAYKAVEVCRLLVRHGAHVVPVLTDSARRFVGAVTFSALASEPVVSSLWEADDPVPHVRLAKRADVVVVVPATANLLGAYAAGLAGDVLSALLLATRAPVVVAPAMHTEMWEHPAVQENLRRLTERGVTVVPPGEGALAAGDVGVGRLAEPEEVVRAVAGALGPRDLLGWRVVVSMGGTREPVDPVRYLGNRSSGRQGRALAEAAVARGAEVVVVQAASEVEPPEGCRVVRVESAESLRRAVLAEAASADVVVMAAAVADFRPRSVETRKIDKGDGLAAIELEPTVDVLAELGAMAERPYLVGFAAETGVDLARVEAKRARKGADLIVANDVARPGVGFGGPDNAVVVVGAEGVVAEVGPVTKRKVAEMLFDLVVQRAKPRRQQS